MNKNKKLLILTYFLKICYNVLLIDIKGIIYEKSDIQKIRSILY
jgi:hypothetical protein